MSEILLKHRRNGLLVLTFRHPLPHPPIPCTLVLLLSWLEEGLSGWLRVNHWELISGCHIVPKHTTMNDLRSLASHRRTASACIPIMCQLLRMRSNCTVGKDPCGPRVLWFPCASSLSHPGHTAKPSRILPPWPIYHHLTVTPLDVQVHPFVFAIRPISSPKNAPTH